MYFLDMGPTGAEIYTMIKNKTVGQYVMCRSSILPLSLAYRAHTIVKVNDDGSMEWYKNRFRPTSTLSEEEKDAMVFQILKSEEW